VVAQQGPFKKLQKTQEEYLYHYIKEFQDAIAGKEAYQRHLKQQEHLQQQKNSRRH
jgi:hypothetical protein